MKITINKIKINNKGEIIIDNNIINEKIFDEEKTEWKIIDRESEIDNLCLWIAESENQNEKLLMLEDLKELILKTDEFCFSSINTNKYIFENEKEFDKICQEILKLNKNIK